MMRGVLKFILCYIFAYTESSKPRTINVALETVFEFDNPNSSDVKLINNIQDLLGKIKNVIRQPQNGRRSLEFHLTNKPNFTDILQSAIVTVKSYNDDDLETLVDIVDEEIRKYHYEGSKVHELVSNNDLGRFMSETLDTIKRTRAKIIRSELESALNTLQNRNPDKGKNSFLNFVNALYSVESTAKLKSLINELKMYKNKTRRAEIDLVKTIRDGVRSLIVDYYTKLNVSARRAIRLKLESYWSDFKKSQKYDHRIYNLVAGVGTTFDDFRTQSTVRKPLIKNNEVLFATQTSTKRVTELNYQKNLQANQMSKTHKRKHKLRQKRKKNRNKKFKRLKKSKKIIKYKEETKSNGKSKSKEQSETVKLILDIEPLHDTMPTIWEETQTTTKSISRKKKHRRHKRFKKVKTGTEILTENAAVIDVVGDIQKNINKPNRKRKHKRHGNKRKPTTVPPTYFRNRDSPEDSREKRSSKSIKYITLPKNLKQQASEEYNTMHEEMQQQTSSDSMSTERDTSNDYKDEIIRQPKPVKYNTVPPETIYFYPPKEIRSQESIPNVKALPESVKYVALSKVTQVEESSYANIKESRRIKPLYVSPIPKKIGPSTITITIPENVEPQQIKYVLIRKHSPLVNTHKKRQQEVIVNITPVDKHDGLSIESFESRDVLIKPVLTRKHNDKYTLNITDFEEDKSLLYTKNSHSFPELIPIEWTETTKTSTNNKLTTIQNITTKSNTQSTESTAKTTTGSTTAEPSIRTVTQPTSPTVPTTITTTETITKTTTEPTIESTTESTTKSLTESTTDTTARPTNRAEISDANIHFRAEFTRRNLTSETTTTKGTTSRDEITKDDTHNVVTEAEEEMKYIPMFFNHNNVSVNVDFENILNNTLLDMKSKDRSERSRREMDYLLGKGPLPIVEGSGEEKRLPKIRRANSELPKNSRRLSEFPDNMYQGLEDFKFDNI